MRESEVPDPGCQAQGCACLWVSRSGCIFVPWGSRDFCASMKVLVLAECLSCTVPGLYSLSPWESPPACCEAMWLDPLQRILSGWRLEEHAVQYKRHRGSVPATTRATHPKESEEAVQQARGQREAVAVVEASADAGTPESQGVREGRGFDMVPGFRSSLRGE